ncbi:hypothetical protein GCK32_013862 [Trichostrongylus colubriformis]|uniref:Uncharacterized protein n=1 Tax=Trichostrongylus colubriformis TaxID=6319 RepID=A0AAN8IE03_TRICO
MELAFVEFVLVLNFLMVSVVMVLLVVVAAVVTVVAATADMVVADQGRVLVVALPHVALYLDRVLQMTEEASAEAAVVLLKEVTN